MKKNQLAKSVGRLVKLQPAANGPLGEPIDEDWRVADVTDDAVVLEHVQSKSIAHVGLDGVFSYLTDAHGRRTSTEKRGFLQLLMQITIAADGAVRVTPLAPPRITPSVPSPLDVETARLAKQQYDSFWPAARGAIRALLIAGDMTGQQVFHYLIGKGEPCDGAEILGRIASCSNLVQRSQPEDTREVRLLGYSGTYTVNPRFRTALEQLVVEDPELRRR
ncbi:MAG: hypothetical protein HY047_18835 [Acidobacteria bacterium]|nr:hypothetical protein [Acidobacteriota bacterium]